MSIMDGGCSLNKYSNNTAQLVGMKVKQKKMDNVAIGKGAIEMKRKKISKI